MTVARRVLVARCAVVVLLSGCSGGAERDVVAESATPAPSPSPSPSDPCAEYPPQFEATYLPPGFGKRLREGAGLFEGPGTAGYPRDGLVGYYA
ncbi:MAG TPA: hypothetical protein VEV43_12230, partial [Actinomycetota bacterium]|nr:hypothetical protein [Actinomycetota bacterium]